MKKLILSLGIFAILPITSCGFSGDSSRVTILFTNDVHGQVDGPVSYASVARHKQDLKDRGENVLLLDSGDFISGGLYCDYDKGKSLVKAMSLAGYDAATLGNHEFDYKLDYLKEIMNEASFPFISSNFYNYDYINKKATTRFTPLGHKIFKFKNASVGVFGLSTPESITSSTPKYFQDEEGHYIYTFLDDKIYEKAQEEIDLMKGKCDYIVCMSHIGDETQESTYTATKLANKTTGIDVILDGHTHQEVKEKKVTDKSGREVIITQTGSKFKKYGRVTLSKHNKYRVDLLEFYPKIDFKIKLLEFAVVDGLDKKYSTKLATSDVNFVRESGSKEDNVGDLVAESIYYYFNSLDEANNCDFAVTNTGGLRANVQPGTWTTKVCKQVLSFSNLLCLKEFDGQTIKTALEFSVYKMPKYFGGQLQVCGITFTVDTSIESDIVIDANKNYVSGPSKGHERITDIKIFNKKTNSYDDFDINKSYKVAGLNYTINNGGDGMKMLTGGKLLRLENDVPDFKGLANYISNFATPSGEELPKISGENSPIKRKYSSLEVNYTDPKLGKRINLK